MQRIIKINLEENLITVSEALAKIEMEISSLALQNEIKVIKIIHGYGSKGVGGEIKKALTFFLEKLKKEHKILDFVSNSKFCKTNKKYIIFTKKYPELILDSDLKNLNPGITLIFLF